MFYEEIEVLKATRAQMSAALEALETDPHATAEDYLALMASAGRIKADIEALAAFKRALRVKH